MYKVHKRIIWGLSILVGILSWILQFRYAAIASDVISVISIAAALYLATYAGIQASPKIRQALNELDGVRKDKKQLFVLNTYIKTALILNLITIVLSCLMLLVTDRIESISATETGVIPKIAEIAGQGKDNGMNTAENEIWTMASRIVGCVGMALFTANLVQMWFVGRFVVNRLAFDK